MIEPLIAAIILVITGVLAGFSSGLLGLAGSYIDNPVMYWMLTHYGYDTNTSVRVAFGTSVAIALVISAVNTREHAKERSIIWKIVVLIGSASIIGGLIGGTIATHVPGGPLKILFGLFLIISAIRMVLPLPQDWGKKKIPLFYWSIAGFLFGLVSGIIGIGGGLIILPMLVCIFGVPVHEAMATSSACIMFSSTGKHDRVYCQRDRCIWPAALFDRICKLSFLGDYCCNDYSIYYSRCTCRKPSPCA